MTSQRGTDIWTAGGPWRFSRESVVVGSAAKTLFALYQQAFGRMSRRAAARQVLTEAEFLTQMSDARIDKYVAWEAGEDDPVGMVTLTRDLDSVPWISPEYYKARYPDHWARNAIYYLGFTLARPGVRKTGFLETVTRMCIRPLLAERAVLAYDVCSYNNDILGFSTLFAEAFAQLSHAQPEELDTQVFYGVDLA